MQQIANGHTQLKKCQFSLPANTRYIPYGQRSNEILRSCRLNNRDPGRFIKIRRDLGNQLALRNPNRSGQVLFFSIVAWFCLQGMLHHGNC